MILSAFEELETENARLRVVLAFYADPRNWTPPTGKAVPISFGDRGAKARQALGLTETLPVVTLQEATKTTGENKL